MRGELQGRGLVTKPKKLSSLGVKRLMERAIWAQGLRKKLEPGKKRHPYQTNHSLRKWFKTRCEIAGMKPINVETLLSHSIGVSDSYYRPTEGELFEDYLKSISLLTIADSNVLQNQIRELNEKSKDNDYLIKTRLQEKDEQIKVITEQFSQIKTQMQSLLSSLRLMDETEKSNFAKQLFKGGLYKKD